MSAFDKIRAMHPDAKSIWCELHRGFVQYTVVEAGSNGSYSHIENGRVFVNDKTGENHYIQGPRGSK